VIINRENADGFSYDYRVNPNLPLMNFGFDVTDPLAYNFGAARSEIRLRPQGVTNKIGDRPAGRRLSPERQPEPEGRRQLQELQLRLLGQARVNESVVPTLPAGVTLSQPDQGGLGLRPQPRRAVGRAHQLGRAGSRRLRQAVQHL
jgi:iron complex outermembrane receptor protein